METGRFSLLIGKLKKGLHLTMQEPLSSIVKELGISIAALSARGLQEYEEAQSLEVAEIEKNGRQHLLLPAAADAWKDLKAAALADGISIFIVSAFRSIDHQVEIIRRKLESGIEIEKILEVNAAPGFSEHHTGRAVDVATFGSSVLEVEFEQTSAFTWLASRGNEFGFYMSYPAGNSQGYQYEPWHWCFHEAPPLNFDILAKR